MMSTPILSNWTIILGNRLSSRPLPLPPWATLSDTHGMPLSISPLEPVCQVNRTIGLGMPAYSQMPDGWGLRGGDS